jgi:hypothetical protein
VHPNHPEMEDVAEATSAKASNQRFLGSAA